MSWIQFKDTTQIEPRVPWYVYGAAILLMGWASFVLWAWLSLSEFGPQFWKNMVLVGLELTIGSGLLFHRRWAWVLGIVTSVLFIGQALRLIVLVRSELAELVALVYFLAPAIVILASLLPGRARRAFLGEGQADAS